MEEYNYLIEQIENGRELNVVVMTHNSRWEYLKMLQRRHCNFKVEICGSHTNHLLRRKDFDVDSCDLIVLDTSSYFDNDEWQLIQNIAFRASEEKSKRVTVGYSYMIPMEERQNIKFSRKINISTFFDSSVVETSFDEQASLPITDLLAIVLGKHDPEQVKLIRECK